MEERRKVTFGDMFKGTRLEGKDLHVSPAILDYLFGASVAEEIVKSYQKKMEDVSKVYRRPKPKSVLVNGDYTTVVWKDGTHTVVKRMEGDEYDFEKAILYAIIKKSFVNSSSDLQVYMNSFDKVKVIKTEPRKD